MWGDRWVISSSSAFISCSVTPPPHLHLLPLTRLSVRLSPPLALRGALRGRSRPSGALPAPPPQRRPAGEAPGRGQSVQPSLSRPRHVEERAARRHQPTQGLSAGSLLSQEREARPGSRAAAEAVWSLQAQFTQTRKLEKLRLRSVLTLFKSMCVLNE